MTGIDIEWFETLFKSKQHERCVEKVLGLSKTSATGKNENFLSEIQRVTLDVILTNGDQAARSYMVKTLPQSDIHEKFVKEAGVFPKEIRMYNEILTPMGRYMEASGDHRERLWCEMIGFQPNHTIVLEDLREHGYQTINPKVAMFDRKTTILVMESLARFHALTVAAEREGIYEPAEHQDYTFVSENFSPYVTAIMRTAAEAIDTFWEPRWRDIATRIRNVSLNQERFKRLKGGNNKLNVLNHGDFWSGNIMLKYDQNKNPVAMKIIDFQHYHYDSFAWDLNHVLYCSVESSIRRQHFNEFLEAYLRSLNDNLRLFGVEMECPLTMEDVQQEMNRLRLFAFFLEFFILALVTSELDDAINLDEWFVSEDKEVKGLNPEIYVSHRFRKLVETDLELFAAEGTI